MELAAAIAAGVMSLWFGWSALRDSAYSGIAANIEETVGDAYASALARAESRSSLTSSLVKLAVCWALAVTAGVIAS